MLFHINNLRNNPEPGLHCLALLGSLLPPQKQYRKLYCFRNGRRFRRRNSSIEPVHAVAFLGFQAGITAQKLLARKLVECNKGI
jgi:hypothetical protein